MTNPTTRLAAKMSCSPENAARIIRQFNDDAVAHTILQDRIETELSQKQKLLDTVEEKDLKKLQGTIAGLKLALTLINAKE